MVLQHISSIFAALLVSVFLLAFPVGGYEVIDEFKYNLFLLLSGGYCVLIIIKRVQLAITGIRPFGSVAGGIRGIPAAMKLLLLFLLITIISAVFSVYPGTFRGEFRREGVLTIAIYIFNCFFLSKYIRPKKWLILLFGGCTVIFCVLSLIQLTGANPLGLFPKGYNFYSSREHFSGGFLGTIGNAGLVGAFLSIAAGVLSMSLIKCDFSKNRFFATTVVSLFLVMLLIFEMDIEAALLAAAIGLVLMLPVAVTGQQSLFRALFVFAIVISAFSISRVIVFGDGNTMLDLMGLHLLFAAGFLVFLGVVVSRINVFEKIPAKWYRAGAACVVALFLCFAIIYLWFFGSGHTGMIYEASEILRGRWDDTFGSTRIYIWRNVLLGITRWGLLLGTGPDTLGFWNIELFPRYIPEFGIMLVAQIDAAHNEYLQILATGGLLSLISYLGALVLVAVNWFRFPDNRLSAVAGAGVLFYCIQAFFSISMFITAPFFWACLAVLIYSQSVQMDEETEIWIRTVTMKGEYKF